MVEPVHKFEFEKLEDLNSYMREFGIQAESKIEKLIKPINICDKTLPNRFVALPMEGVDGINGSPSEITRNRYLNLARGGYGLIWLEATSVNEEGMSNDRQLFINENNVNDFKKLNNDIKEESKKSSYNAEAYTVLQLNHSGRYANKNKVENAQIATHRNKLDLKRNIEEDRELIKDFYLDKLKLDYLKAARLSKKSGFDAVDIKACHGYLLSELLSATDREGNYGGSFENRTRLLMEIIDLIKNDEQCKGLDITVRLNMCDLTENGFSTTKDLEYDLEETFKVIDILHSKGVQLISLTLGNPYFIPNIGKPSDTKKDQDIESPVVSLQRIFKLTSNLQEKFPDIKFVGLGYTWFRQFSVNVAEHFINSGKISLAGFGRESIAYTDLPNDVLENNFSDEKKVCITCNLCSKLKSNFLPTGCVVRNGEVYSEYLKEIS